MAKGYPDFFGFSMFPYYGTISRVNAVATAVAGGDTDIMFNIAGKGVIGWGYLNVASIDDAAGSWIRVTLDGAATTYFYMDTTEAAPWLTSQALPLFVCLSSRERGRFGMAISGEISFNDQFQVEVHNAIGAGNLAVSYEINYHQILT